MSASSYLNEKVEYAGVDRLGQSVTREYRLIDRERLLDLLVLIVLLEFQPARDQFRSQVFGTYAEIGAGRA